MLAASHAELGSSDAANAAARRLLEIAPAFTIGGFARMDVYPSNQMDRLAVALRKAGLPD